MPESDCGQAGDYEGKGQFGKLCYGNSVNINKVVPECSVEIFVYTFAVHWLALKNIGLSMC